MFTIITIIIIITFKTYKLRLADKIDGCSGFMQKHLEPFLRRGRHGNQYDTVSQQDSSVGRHAASQNHNSGASHSRAQQGKRSKGRQAESRARCAAMIAPVFDLLSDGVLSKLGDKQRLSVTVQRFIKPASGLKAEIGPPYHH